MELLFLAEYHKLADGERESVLSAIQNAGIEKLVLSSGVYEYDLAHPGFLDKLCGFMEKRRLSFASAHGLWSANNDLNWPDERGREEMVRCQVRYLEKAAALGCRSFVLHPGVAYMRYDRQKLWDKVRKSVESLLPEAEKNRIILALENNVTMNLGIDCAELADFISSFDSPFLGACFDSGHAHAVSDVLASFAALAPHVVTAHLHDNDGSGDQHRLPGAGTIPWEKLMALLGKAPRLCHVESEPAGMGDADKILQALAIYTKLPGISR